MFKKSLVLPFLFLSGCTFTPGYIQQYPQPVFLDGLQQSTPYGRFSNPSYWNPQTSNPTQPNSYSNPRPGIIFQENIAPPNYPNNSFQSPYKNDYQSDQQKPISLKPNISKDSNSSSDEDAKRLQELKARIQKGNSATNQDPKDNVNANSDTNLNPSSSTNKDINSTSSANGNTPIDPSQTTRSGRLLYTSPENADHYSAKPATQSSLSVSGTNVKNSLAKPAESDKSDTLTNSANSSAIVPVGKPAPLTLQETKSPDVNLNTELKVTH